MKQLKIDANDNITIVNSENEDEVIAVITEEEIITKEGFEVMFDVGVE